MHIWSKSIMTTLYRSSDPSTEYPCVVKIENNDILVEYYQNNRILQYKGKSNGVGHFELQAIGFYGRATLHRFMDSSVLEGSWIEEGCKGMWSISLS